MSARKIAAVLGVMFFLQCGLTTRPSFADDDRDRWEHHDRGRHRGWGHRRREYYAPRREYYYAPRPEVYYYEPPPVYVLPPPPPPSVGFDLIFPFRFH